MPDKPKLRGKARARESLYPLGEITDDVIVGVGRMIVHHLAVGHADITGDSFADIFAKSISGEHRGWQVLTVWECQLKNEKSILKKLERLLCVQSI